MNSLRFLLGNVMLFECMVCLSTRLDELFACVYPWRMAGKKSLQQHCLKLTPRNVSKRLLWDYNNQDMTAPGLNLEQKRCPPKTRQSLQRCLLLPRFVKHIVRVEKQYV
eukprot:5965252-Amphidinium_carterae.1